MRIILAWAHRCLCSFDNRPLLVMYLCKVILRKCCCCKKPGPNDSSFYGSGLLLHETTIKVTMKKIILAGLLCYSLCVPAQQAGNTLLEPDFWRNNPTLDAVKSEIGKGNKPSDENGMHMDVLTLAINSNASIDIIRYLLDQKGVNVNKAGHEQRAYLHWATMRGNTEVIRYLIQKGADINLEDDHELSPLYLAMSNGMCKKELIELFLKAGLSPLKTYKDGANLLLIAAPYDKEMEITNYLIGKGIPLNSRDANGATAVDYAARRGNIDMMKALLNKGIKPTPNALLLAAQGTRRESNSVELYRYLVDELKLNPTVKDKAGNSLLQLVAGKPNQDEVATYLLDKGLNANEATPAGETPLTQAMATGSSSMVALLLHRNADIRVVDKKGYNLTYYLMQSYRPAGGRGGMRGANGGGPLVPAKDEFAEKLRLLQERNFDLKAPQKDGSTLLHYAATTGDLNLVKKVVAMGIDLNAQNDDGMTALHKAAATAKDDRILRFLVEAGANKTLKTSFDESAYDLVSSNANFKKNNIDVEFLK